MAVSALKSLAKDLAAHYRDRGFVSDGAYRLKRAMSFVVQFIEIQPGREWLDGKFTCNLCWLFTADGTERNDIYHNLVRIGQIAGKGDLWLPYDSHESISASRAQLIEMLDQYGIPFLDEISDLKRILAISEGSIESPLIQGITALDRTQLFAADEGWRNYNLGFSYKALGMSEEARHHLQLAIQVYGNAPSRSELERRERCEKALREL